MTEGFTVTKNLYHQKPLRPALEERILQLPSVAQDDRGGARFGGMGNPSPTIEKACHSERRHSRSRRIYAPKDYSAETIMRRSFDALRLLRMTEEGRDIGGHRWSPPPPLLLPLPLGEVPARSKGGEGPLSHADRVTAFPEGEPRPHPPLRGNRGCGRRAIRESPLRGTFPQGKACRGRPLGRPEIKPILDGSVLFYESVR